MAYTVDTILDDLEPCKQCHLVPILTQTTCFPFRNTGGFLCLLRHLPQALANSFCSG